MNELVMRICNEKNAEKKLVLVEELKQVLGREAELLRALEINKRS